CWWALMSPGRSRLPPPSCSRSAEASIAGSTAAIRSASIATSNVPSRPRRRTLRMICMRLGRHSGSALGGRPDLPAAHPLGGKLHRGDDVLVARAPAQVARDRLADLPVVPVRGLRKERLDRHQETRRAEAALQTVALVEGLLERMQSP